MPAPRPPDPADVGALYDAHAELVWKSLHRLGVRSADVPDLLQEVFLVVHRGRGALEAGRPIEPFLWGIALGLVRNYRRRAFRRLEVLGDDRHASSGSDPEEELSRSRRQRRAEQALDALEPEKRAVFVMFELERMSGRAIADVLGVPLGTVHSRLFAARRELAEALREDDGAEVATRRTP